jgi:hypothetical protein
MKKEEQIQFAICLDNEGYRASLKVGKLYQIIPDNDADIHGYIRIIDESGEDYAFTANRFHILQLPLPVEKMLSAALCTEKSDETYEFNALFP